MRLTKKLTLTVMASLTLCANAEKSLVDFFKPMEIQKPLVSEGIWGGKNVLPRDTANGMEDATLKNWCYWDGSIVKSDDGKYHMYASRWSQTVSHSNGWKTDSKAIHAVSDNVNGPYVDKGLAWPDWQPEDEGEENVYYGKGHNVWGFRMHDGRYGIVTSEITPGYVFASTSPDGPFKCLGKIEVDYNGYPEGLAHYNKAPYHMANVQIVPRPDGKYMIIARSTAPMISDNILGPYKIMGPSVYSNESSLPQDKNEDPCVWYSGGLYHLVYNNWPTSCCYHFTSKDGINNWKYRGIAFKKDDFKIFKYTDGTENNWSVVQRPIAVVENGHVTHFLFSVIDSEKGEDAGNDNHGSKIVIVPFDGVAFDEYMQEVVANDPPEEEKPTYENNATDNNALNSHVFSFEPVNNIVGAGWYIQHTNQFSITNEKSYHGEYSLKFCNTDATTSGTLQTQGSYTNAVFATPSIDAGDYNCSIKCFASDQAPDNFHIAFVYPGGFKSVDYTLSSIKRNEWIELKMPVTLPDIKEGTRKINLQVKGTAQLGTIYIDQIRLEPKTTSTSASHIDNGVKVVTEHGKIKVINGDNQMVNVYTTDGTLLVSKSLTNNTEYLNPDGNGILIVKVGDYTTKVNCNK